jgi:hypothetical protein
LFLAVALEHGDFRANSGFRVAFPRNYKTNSSCGSSFSRFPPVFCFSFSTKLRTKKNFPMHEAKFGGKSKEKDVRNVSEKEWHKS